jgi:hypothetical protein
MPATVPAPVTAAQPTGGRIAPRLIRVSSQGGPQRGQVEVATVGHRDDHDPRDIIGEREREQIGAHPVGDTRADQGQHAQRERGVGGHGRAPAGRR